MYKTKLRKIGKSKGIILPKELLDRMNVREGDVLMVHETREGYMVSPYDASLAEDMALADRFVAQYRNTLKKLAE